MFIVLQGVDIVYVCVMSANPKDKKRKMAPRCCIHLSLHVFPSSLSFAVVILSPHSSPATVADTASPCLVFLEAQNKKPRAFCVKFVLNKNQLNNICRLYRLGGASVELISIFPGFAFPTFSWLCVWEYTFPVLDTDLWWFPYFLVSLFPGYDVTVLPVFIINFLVYVFRV